MQEKKESHKNVLIFLDIDGTLLDKNYKATSSATKKLVRQLTNDGVLFGLNSNRSVHDILPIAKRFGITGPIIAENGIVLRVKNSTTQLLNLPPVLKKFREFLAAESQSQSAQYAFLDTIKNKKKNRKGLFWAVNKYRSFTVSIHVTRDGKPSLPDARNLEKKLNHVFGSEYTIYVSPIFANVLVSPALSGKEVGLQALLKKKAFRNKKVIMIGDDSADLKLKPFVHKFFAVGNATPEVKEIADYVSNCTHTKGVDDILKKLKINI